MANQAEVDKKFNKAFNIGVGTYTVASVTFMPKVGLKGDIEVSDGATAMRLYTKQCGATTCGSACLNKPSRSHPNMRDCAGSITDAAPAKGSTSGFGTVATSTRGTGAGGVQDIWTPTPYQFLEGSPAGRYDGYWRRCAQRMDTAPSQLAFLNSKNGGASAEVVFLHPLVVTAADVAAAKARNSGNAPPTTTASTPVSAAGNNATGASFNLHLAYALEGIIRGNVKPFNSRGGAGVAPTAYYDMSDGFYQINLAALGLTPIAFRGGQQVWRFRYKVMVRKNSSVPICMNGTAWGQGTPRGRGLCHPCHHFPHDCVDQHDMAAGVLNNQRFDTSATIVSQDFDLNVDLFFVGHASTSASAAAVDQTKLRAVSVTKLFNTGFPITRDIPFTNLRVERTQLVRGTPASGTPHRYHFLQGLHWTRGYEIPLIRDFDTISSIGGTGKCKLIL